MSGTETFLLICNIILLIVCVFLWRLVRTEYADSRDWEEKFNETNEAAKSMISMNKTLSSQISLAESNSVFFYKECKGLKSAMNDLHRENRRLRAELQEIRENQEKGEDNGT